MLAVPGQPFDSHAHFFEFKWDGIRVQALIEHGAHRLVSRNGVDITARYPSLAGLAALPAGLALDGELVALRDGKPDFELVLRSMHRESSLPVSFVVFDVLYKSSRPLLAMPFSERREILEEIIRESQCPGVILSEGVRARGKMLYQTACEQGLEGVVAKRLSSTYAAGKRNGAWVKIKRRLRVHVAIIGYIEKEGDDFQSLLVAGNGLPGEKEGALRYIGRVGGGFTEEVRERINRLLKQRPRDTPLVSCPERARWVEPGLYCAVSFAELTSAGLLRAPVFEGLLDA
jgi:bifunctional non-homologous end joining protein LigD